MTWWLGLSLLACALALAALALTTYGASRWARATQALLQSLEQAQAQNRQAASEQNREPQRYSARELEGLPAPVQRYFRAALTDGQPIIGAVTIELAGRFNLSTTAEHWRPFSSRQRITARRPGFLWDAKINMLPGVNVRVVDGYIAGQGLLRAALQGLFTVAHMQGEGEIARGELMRWFAELPWHPTSLLPSLGVRWQPVDQHSANASFTDGPLSLTLLFRFNEAGLIASIYAEARGAMVGGKMIQLPWEGRWSNYQTRSGMKLPMSAEVAWLWPQGRRAYFVGEVSSLVVEFAG